MKRALFMISLLGFTGLLWAQKKELRIKSSEKGLYLEHKVAAKENYYSIGRLYHVHPKHIASYNALDMTKGLAMGKLIRIPLTDTNFLRTSDQGTPIYYITGENEQLANISDKYSHVPVDTLRSWNHIESDSISRGQKLIVGFLASNEMKNITSTEKPTEKYPIKVEEKEEPKKVEENVESKKEDSKEPNKTEVTEKYPIKVEVKEEPKKAEENIESKKEDNKEPKKTEPTEKYPIKVEIKEEPKKTEEDIESKKDALKEESQEPKKNEDVSRLKDETKTADASQGYFKASFEQQSRQSPSGKSQTVTSGIFKTSSGWTDWKYYLLVDGIENGTIVKIVNPANNKIIYAKVLGEMSGLPGNDGLDIRISNAAAAILSIEDTDKFIIKINF